MIERKAILVFPKELAGEPLVSRVIHAYEVEVNILSAFIAPNEEGRMFLSIRGERGAVQSALDQLSRDIEVTLPDKQLEWLEELCIHCGACAGQCAAEALTVEPESARLQYTPDRCTACRLCLDSCYYGALQAGDQRIVANGGLR
jgi:formate hydrogenlyase subunit 6/NADH:ubiquinone oxidoreductase subunit I